MYNALKWADVKLTNANNSLKQLTNVAAQKPRAGEMAEVKNTVLAEALSSHPSTHDGQLTVPHRTPAPEDRKPSSGLCEYIHSHAQTYTLLKIKIHLFIF